MATLSIPAETRIGRLRLAGVASCIAAVAAVIADLALQYTPNRAELFSSQYLYLAHVPEWRLLLGHYLGILALPFEIGGFWLVYQALTPAGKRVSLAFFLLTAYGVAVGPALHGSAGLLALVVQASQGAPADVHQSLAHVLEGSGAFTMPLGVLILLCLLAASLVYAAAVAFMHTRLPRWMALCNPLTLVLLFALLSSIVPGLALILAPTALNLSVLIFFALCTVALWRGGRDTQPVFTYP